MTELSEALIEVDTALAALRKALPPQYAYLSVEQLASVSIEYMAEVGRLPDGWDASKAKFALDAVRSILEVG